MDKIERTLGQLFQGRDFEKQYETLKQQVLAYSPVQDFLKANNEDINEQIINQNLSKLYEFMTEHQKYQDKKDTLMPGYAPRLSLNGDYITVTYYPTEEKIQADRQRAIEKRIRSLYMPKQIMEATMDDFTIDNESRSAAFLAAGEFLSTYQKGSTGMQKGLYIHGSFGTGKSYLLGAMAKDLALKGISTTLVYLPEFMREIKQSIADNSVGEKIQFAKETEILMLDDIGAESMTTWTRDEVLGAILQFRMQEELPTFFFSSNYSMEHLENHLMFSNNGNEERMKARRIMERVRYLAKEVELDGRNRRY
ncbi:primosomal protein DnaI [Listeria weihenstephanensis FSL R9-0317]|uniref:primosomal protein DnaI n=1 Tax=Listeria weihenstephanensis TaxID=1006155 RepID=UPI0003E88EBD|nr:primosomal protein DnaI [Listeria weihenstephanensis]EUJ36772.1 primosomal protein DnaI [Listeria weihenstephanensis FSL R9-0317]